MPLIPYVAVRYMKYFFGHRFRLAAFTRKSRTFDKVVQKAMFDGDDMTVLPKDHLVKKSIKMDIDFEDGGERTVLPSDVVKGVIDKAEDIFIMNFCICRKSNECDDYPVDHGCMFMGKGTRKIPPEFGRMATREEAKAYIDECGELGLVHIVGRNKLDTIWLNTGHKRDLMTICNCCPCCCLWNMTREISDGIGNMFHRLKGVEVSFDSEKCIGCGSCAEICFTKAVKIIDGKASINQDMCRGCGRCAESCPVDAISIVYDDTVIKSEIERIGELVDL